MTSVPLPGCKVDMDSDRGALTGDNVFKLVRLDQKEIYYYKAEDKRELLR